MLTSAKMEFKFKMIKQDKKEQFVIIDTFYNFPKFIKDI